MAQPGAVDLWISFEGFGDIKLQAAENKIYVLNEKPPVFYPTHLFRDIEEHQAARKRKNLDIAKILLKERISGRSIADMVPENSLYLDSNAQTRDLREKTRDLEEKAKENSSFLYRENLINVCGQQVIWLMGAESSQYFHKKIDCKKAWCPVCGGKNGKIHKARLHSVLSRVELENYNIQQLIFTMPLEIRYNFENRKKLDLLIAEIKKIIEKNFGVPVFHKSGNIKKYKLENGVIFNQHLFGDKKLGLFNPHFNIQILIDKKENPVISKLKLQIIKDSWLKVLQVFEAALLRADVHYSFRDSKRKNIFSIKYMCKSWGAENYAAIGENEKLKKFLVCGLSGFQYIRFWGSLANCKYKDEMTLPEVVVECEKKINEKLIALFIAPYDRESWKDKVEEIDEGFFMVKTKFNKDFEEYQKMQKLIKEKI